MTKVSEPSVIDDLAQRYWQLEMAGDIEGVVACYAQDAELHLPDGDVRRGHDAIRAFYEASQADYPTRTVTIVDRVHDAAGRAALVWEAQLQAPDGSMYLLRGINVVTVIEGRFQHLSAAYPSPRPATAGGLTQRETER